MRFLANENIPAAVVFGLRQRGHDVLAAKESMRGMRDPVVLARAQAEARVLLTCDKDFGELAFRAHLPAACGVVLFRLSGADNEADNRRILEVLDSPLQWPGYFAVADARHVRQRPLPAIDFQQVLDSRQTSAKRTARDP